MLTWGNSPMASAVPAEWGPKILYGRITIGDSDMVGADAHPEGYQQPSGFSILLNMSDVTEAQRIFAALAEGGKINTALQKTFWAECYGGVTDRFGIPWEINCEKPEQVSNDK